jgi:hypothetical protein
VPGIARQEKRELVRGSRLRRPGWPGRRRVR